MSNNNSATALEHYQDEAEAWVELCRLFQERNWRTDPSLCQTALDILETYPDLASRGIATDSAYPLHYFVALGPNADLESVRRVYNLCPSAISIQSEFGEFAPDKFRQFPLHIACYAGAPEEVVEFLLQKNSSIVNIDCASGLKHGISPIHLALQRKMHLPQPQWPTLRLIQLLVETAETAEKTILKLRNIKLRNRGNLNALETALNLSYSIDIVRYLIGKHPRDASVFILKTCGINQSVFSVDVAEAVGQLLPQLTELTIICSKYLCQHGFIRLMHLIGNIDSLQTLTIQKMPNEFLKDQVPVWEALKYLIEHNDSLQNLSLSAWFEDPNVNRGFLHSLAQGLRVNVSIRKLTLEGLEIPDSTVFFRLLQQGSAVEELSLEDVRIVADWQSLEQSDVGRVWEPNPHLKTFFISALVSRINAASFNCLIAHLMTRMPNLKALSFDTLSYWVFDNSTNSLVDFPALCDLLRTNTTVSSIDCHITTSEESFKRFLKVLEHQNTTLAHVSSHKWRVVEESTESKNKSTIYLQNHKLFDPIIFWLTLNRFGRGKARNLTMTRTLVELFRAVQEHNDSTQRPRNPVEKLSVIYGLLHEAPSTWSCCHAKEYCMEE